ncbi:integral membrane protein [Streptomyces bingchenggensis BCW-1]|uniref:Integral membrane protein n=1 Tax=Streptomyces bingchenggensis (strain BCW-1) TaxID=749414 RepID=D7BRK1_STRBB|nr:MULTISPECIES: DUF5134 domain-containing protein [Streptomyces]ADI05164.1 integral membrane protein [Streptomyces bingchenggensis BCW-1]
MHGPPLAGWLLVALCAATGSYCLLRMRGEPPGRVRRAAGAEALMGWGMAVMAVPAAALDPRPWGPPLLAAVFAVAAVRALLPAWHRGGRALGHHLHHAVGALAMVYMALAMAVGTPARGHGHAGHAAQGRVPGGVPALTAVLLVYFAVYVVWSATRLAPAGAGSGSGGLAWSRRPELADACRLSMGIGMLAMLLTL